MHVLGLLELRAEGYKGVQEGTVTGLGRGIAGQRGEGVGQCSSPDIHRGGGGGASVLLAKTVGQGVQEDSVDGSGGSIHDVLDNADDAVHCVHDIVGERRRGVFDELKDGLGATLQAYAAVSVSDDGVEAGDFGLGGNDTLECTAQDLLEGINIH